jgi:hypothetical protein
LSEKYLIGIFLAKDKYFLQPGETRKSGGFAPAVESHPGVFTGMDECANVWPGCRPTRA